MLIQRENQQLDTEPIRVLHVIGIMNRGGAETMIMNLYRQIDRSKIQFDFVENSYAPAAFDDEIIALGGRIYRCPHYNGRNHLSYVKWWVRFFEEHASDYAIVHGHLGSTASIYLSCAKQHGIYTIAHSHNTNGTGLNDLIYRLYAYPTRKIADFFFACSVDAGKDRFGEKVTKDSAIFHVLNNAIDTRKFRYDEETRRRIRELYGLEDSIVFGHVGRFSAQKNHAFLIDIFECLAKQCSCAKLLLIGDGELKEQTLQKVKQKGLQDKVLFLGVREDTAAFYQAMDILLFPSFFEGLGVVLVEAQTAGLHCVISDVIPEEAILSDDLVTICKLSDPPVVWAEHVLQLIPYQRGDHSKSVSDKGFDITQTARWLESFYREKSNQT